MPLKGIKVLELAGLAPAPFCGMILADFGATVTRVDRIHSALSSFDFLGNGKRSIALNLKKPEGTAIFKKLSDQSDVLIEPFRKGIMENLQLGPNVLMASNEKLIYARLTGFGQDGLYAHMAGHDINYVALSGLLSLFGRASEKPTPPVNLAADFAGGGLICALGIILALYERTKSNIGQIIDASMVEGCAYTASWLYRSQQAPGLWGKPRGRNLLDTGTHFYDTYETKDGLYMAVGALEPQFYSVLMKNLGFSEDEMPQYGRFEENREKLSIAFKSKTQEEWCRIFDGTDACVTPVLDIKGAADHAHNRNKGTFTITENDTVAPNPAPRLSRTPGKSAATRANPIAGEHTNEILFELGYKPKEIDDLIHKEIVGQGNKRSNI